MGSSGRDPSHVGAELALVVGEVQAQAPPKQADHGGQGAARGARALHNDDRVPTKQLMLTGSDEHTARVALRTHAATRLDTNGPEPTPKRTVW